MDLENTQEILCGLGLKCIRQGEFLYATGRVLHDVGRATYLTLRLQGDNTRAKAQITHVPVDILDAHCAAYPHSFRSLEEVAGYWMSGFKRFCLRVPGERQYRVILFCTMGFSPFPQRSMCVSIRKSAWLLRHDLPWTQDATLLDLALDLFRNRKCMPVFLDRLRDLYPKLDAILPAELR